MHTTSVTLLQRIRSDRDDVAWRRFVELYAPLIHRWALGLGLSVEESSDLLQEVLLRVHQCLPSFEYDENKSFRSWLKTVAMNRARDFLRRRRARREIDMDVGPVPETEDHVEFLSAKDYNDFLVARALELMRNEFTESTWRACWMFTTEGKSADEVAALLGVSPNAVYLAKARVLRRLREELGELLEAA